VDDQLALIEEIANYVHDPLGFCRVMFPWGEGELAGIKGPRTWQLEELAAIGAHLQNPKTRFTPYLSAIVSGNGPGKSALVGMVAKWAMSTCPGCRVMITANTGAQLNVKTQPEVAKWFRLAEDRDFWDVQATRISIKDPKYRASYRLDFETWNENNPEAISGLHNLGKRIVVIFDEASGIPRIIWDHIKGALTDANTEIIWLAFGNGTLNEGSFFECFHKNQHAWHTRHIDTRTVEGTNKEEIARWIEEDGLDSDWVRVHVLGLFPRQSELQFIGHDVVDKARRYKAQGYESLPKILACDVARFGSCETVHGYRQGRKYVELERYRKMDTQFTGQRVIEHIKEIQPDAVVVDAGGIGGAVVDYCRALGYQIHAFDASSAAHDSRKYGNRRAEVWAKGKFWLEAGAQIPDDDSLAEQIAGPHFYYRQGQASHGALMIERKEDMSKRGLESPDRADTFMLTHAVDPAPPKPKPSAEPWGSSGPRTGDGGWMNG
jgi:hypothetical protein